MILFGRCRTRRSHITDETQQQVGTTSIRCHQAVPSDGSTKRNRSRYQWPARTAFDWLAYTSRNQGLRLLRRMKIHVDTTLRTCDGFQEDVHWQVISAFCQRLLDQSTVIIKNQSCVTRIIYLVTLPESITSSIARLIVECAYGESELALNRTNINDFYKVAIEYDIQHAISVCLDYARKILDVNNCIYLLQLSLAHKHQKLRRAAYTMIRTNFKLVLHLNSDFQHLHAKQLRQLLLDDVLRINEDEEIAWLAIVRWCSGRDTPMSQSELARLYNQMVSEPQEVLRRTTTTTWPAPSNPQHQLVTMHNQHLTLPSETNNQQRWQQQQQQQQQYQSQLIRLTLDFYSPIEESTTAGGARNQRAKSSRKTDTSPKSPLRAAATAAALRQGCSADFASFNQQREEELYRLIKCLRFMRFKSPGAFDVILAHPRVNKSTRLTQLVQHMRLRYKLRHKIALTDQDKQMIEPGEVRKIKDGETNRTQRVVKSVGKLISSSLRPPSRLAVGAQNASPTAGTSPRTDSKHQQQHQRQQGSSSAAAARARLTPELVHNQFTARSLERASRPRVPTSVGLLIGGWQDGSVTNTIWAYDFVFDKWFKLNIKLPDPRAFHASCSTPERGQVYIFGGTDGKAILNSVLRIHPASDVFISSHTSMANQIEKSFQQQMSNKRSCEDYKFHAKRPRARLVYKFKKLCPMSERRCHLSGLLHSDGRIYALGGHNGTQRLRSGEWYDPQSNQWHSIAEMTIARADAAACSHDNKIFIAGGQISDSFIQSSVEFYKSSDNTWTFAAPMIIPRMAFSMVSYRGHLFAIGGTNGLMGGEEVASVTRSVERYNQNAGAWAFCAPMLQKRCAFGVMQIENKLLVMGGHGGRRRLKTCESLKIGNFTSQTFAVSLSSALLNQSLRQPVANPEPHSELQSNVLLSLGKTTTTNDPSALAVSSNSVQQRQQQSAPGHEQTRQASAMPARSLPELASLAGRQLTANDLMRRANSGEMPMPVRSAMKWIPRANLPERRSGFSIAVVHKLRNAKDYTYFGAIKSTARGSGGGGCESTCTNSNINGAAKPSFIKQPSRWQKFKIIKRRKLVKHLKIALIVTVVILLM